MKHYKRFAKSEASEMKHIFITNPNPNGQIYDDVIVVIGTKDDIKNKSWMYLDRK